MEIVREAGVQVEHAVENVQETRVEGALLTVLAVFLFLDSGCSTVITGLALPVSALALFISVWDFGFTLDTLSLRGHSRSIRILIAPVGRAVIGGTLTSTLLTMRVIPTVYEILCGGRARFCSGSPPRT